MTDNSTPMPPRPRTALPWSSDAFNELAYSAGEPDYSAFILGADGESILAQQIGDQDAAYIVWACNNAEALLSALEKIATNRPDGKCKAGTTCRAIARAAIASARP